MSNEVSSDKDGKEQSNPFSTGGGGVNFETKVQATFALFMLAEKFVPCLPNYPIEKIKLQGKYDGFDTDDCIVYVKNRETDKSSKLLIQIKHSISITENDPVFREVIQAAWNDFENQQLFNEDTDEIALVTAVLSKTDIKNVRPLFDWACFSENETEFLKKVNSNKFSSSEKKKKLKAFRKNLDSAKGQAVTDKELWRFMKKFHLLAYDLDSDSSIVSTMIQSFISQCVGEEENNIWEKVISIVQSCNQNAGTIKRLNFPCEICDKFQNNQNNKISKDIRIINEHGNYILEGIKSDIGGETIHRNEALTKLTDYCSNSDIVLVTGERGCGKSGLIKEFVSNIKKNEPIIVLRTEELEKSHLQSVFSDIGIQSTLYELEAQYALYQNKYLIIESMEKLLELNKTGAFLDLFEYIRKQSGWTIIATVRDYAYKQIIFNYINLSQVKYNILTMDNFNEEELCEIREQVDILNDVFKNVKIKELLSNPFYLDLAYRALKNGGEITCEDEEKEFQQMIWSVIIQKDIERSNGLPIKRRDTFIKIAVERAKSMRYGVSDRGLNAEAIMKLEEDNLIRRDSQSSFVFLTHDVLEDWALEKYIDEIYIEYGGDIGKFITAIGYEPAMNRAYRLWLNKKQKHDLFIKNFVIKILRKREIDKCWHEETIAAILSGDNLEGLMDALGEVLLEDRNSLLKRFCFMLRLSCKIPDKYLNSILVQNDEEYRNILPMILKPYGESWDSIISYLYRNFNRLDKSMFIHIVFLLNEWSQIININDELPKISRTAGLLALNLLERVKDSYSDKEEKKKIFEVVIKVIPSIKGEFTKIIENEILGVENRKRARYVDDFCEYMITDIGSGFMAKYDPELLIKISLHEWMPKKDIDKYNMWESGPDVDGYFGLEHYNSSMKFFPSSGARAPFNQLFRLAPRKALDFVIELCNITSKKYVYSNLDFKVATDEDGKANVEYACVNLQLNDRTMIKQYCSGRLWGAYRGMGNMPNILESALMTLENWLIEYIEYFKDNKDEVEGCFNYILSKSKSVMTTAVLTSVATGYYKVIGKAALPLLKVAEFYDIDLSRSVNERGGNEINWFSLNNDPLRKLYINERRTAALRPWRKDSLETLCIKLQFTELREEVLKIIDELRELYSEDVTWKFRFHRIDTREYEYEYDEKQDGIICISGKIEDKLEEIQKEKQEELRLHNRFMKLYLWSDKKLKDEKLLDGEHYIDWRYVLQETQELKAIADMSENDTVISFLVGGILKAVIILLKERATDMEKSDLKWCKEFILRSVEISIENEVRYVIEDKDDTKGVAAAAEVLPLLLDYVDNKKEKEKIKKLIIVGFTHHDNTVRKKAAEGICKYLWDRDNKFAKRCVVGSGYYALERKAYNKKRRAIYFKRFENEDNTYYKKWISKVRKKLYTKKIDMDINFMNIEDCSLDCLLVAFTMINRNIDYEYSGYIKNLLLRIFEIENNKRDYTREKESDTEEYYKVIGDLSKKFAYYILNLDTNDVEKYYEELNLGCELAPEFIKYFLTSLDYFTELKNDRSIYWKIWKSISNTVENIAIDLDKSNGYKYDDRSKLIRSMMYVDCPWQKVDYERQTIKNGARYIMDFVKVAGTNPDVFEALCSLIYHFSNIFFDEGLLILAGFDNDVINKNLAESNNSVFYLEKVLHRYILIDTSSVIEKDMYDACLKLINELVEKSSSEAYYVREYLIKSKKIG
ncbi:MULTISPECIES: hypothetical protein [unclassified Clostridium]|uniref:hypothetical protein n=1 Tax=unclassified Clostridium TaxID=2614128 RepID=UPI003F93989D